MATFAGEKKRVVGLGGGFGGAFAAQALQKKGQGDVEVVLIDRNNFLTFYPLLVEAGVGAIEPRHIVVPLRKFVRGDSYLMAEVRDVDLRDKTVTYQVSGSDEVRRMRYDHLVIGLGSVTKIPPIPGLKEYGFEMKSLNDAIEHRDRGIRMLELANTLTDPLERKRLLTFVVVGGGYTGVELAGEYQAFLREAAKEYPNVEAADIRMLLLEYGPTIIATMSEKLRQWAHRTLEERGVEVRTSDTITEVHEDGCVLKDGSFVPTKTVYWTAGIAPSPLLKEIEGLPVNEKGYIDCDRDLSVKGFSDVWAIGDAATVFTADGKPYAATAQNASRQGPLVAQNILARIRGGATKTFDFKPLGAFAAIGHRQAAAEVKGLNFTGFIGWVLFRGAYLTKMPTLAMKARLSMDWLLELIFRSPIVQMGVHRRKVAPVASPGSESLETAPNLEEEPEIVVSGKSSPN
ncbi:NAD(P)/FAD-dependent oxidoreductase [bacterium]|nr:MAG: NAD(P)/FAD-dependent oxidoreductase [bacterium]